MDSQTIVSATAPAPVQTVTLPSVCTTIRIQVSDRCTWKFAPADDITAIEAMNLSVLFFCLFSDRRAINHEINLEYYIRSHGLERHFKKEG